MQRFEKVAEALRMVPASILLEPGLRSSLPSGQVKCIDAFKWEHDCLQKRIKATSTLVEHGYPLRIIVSGLVAPIVIEKKVRNDPTVTVTISSGSLERIEQYLVLDPKVEHESGIRILCIMEAASEYLYNRIEEESKFLDHITEGISTET